MKIILIQDVQNMGKKGDIKEIAPGFASNFLIPKKLAILATLKELEKLNKLKELEEQKRKTEEEKLKKMAEKIDDLLLELTEKADEQGTLYGSVDKKRIAGLLAEKGFEIDQEKIKLFSHIKKTGEHQVELELLPHLKAKIKLNIKTGV